MEPSDLLSTVAASSAAIVDAAGTAGLDAMVPTCPGWDMAALLRHVGAVHRWAASLVEHAADGYEPMGGGPGEGTDLVHWFVEGSEQLVATLTAEGPSAPVWNFAGAPAAALFWFRRMAHETAVHAWDAAAAAGTAAPLDATLASDGIDEFLTVMVPRRRPEGLRGTVHVHCTDVAGEWLVDLSTMTTRREHAKGDVALRGPASDLLLRLVGRADGGEVIGDAAVLETFTRAVRY